MHRLNNYYGRNTIEVVRKRVYNVQHGWPAGRARKQASRQVEQEPKGQKDSCGDARSKTKIGREDTGKHANASGNDERFTPRSDKDQSSLVKRPEKRFPSRYHRFRVELILIDFNSVQPCPQG